MGKMVNNSYWILLSFLTLALAKPLFASENLWDDSNLSPKSSKAKDSDLITSPSQIYALEEKLIGQFRTFKDHAIKQNQGEDQRGALKVSFEQLRALQAFKDNYVSYEARDHIFHVPIIMVESADTPQIKRLKKGKAFVSPMGKTSFQGHHTNQEDAIDESNPAHVWVITRTNHKGHHGDLHVQVDHSHVNRNTFAGAKREAYKYGVADEAENKKLKRSLLGELNK